MADGSETVIEAANDLLRFKTHDDMVFALFSNLATAESGPVKSAWFLELARAHISNDVYRPRKHTTICQLLDDEQLAKTHSAIVRESLGGFDPAATYWRDTFTLLGTTADA
jgi:hypothetical protein